jgi:hypothetical protein
VLFTKSHYTLPLLARRSIRDDWLAQKETVTNGIQEELLGAPVKLMVDYEAIWKLLVDAKNVTAQTLSATTNH